MSFYDLCRLCCLNQSESGVIVYPDDERHQKIRECLSIIIADERFKICTNCDNKLECFYQFRIDTVKAQHQFSDMLRSMQPAIQYQEQEFTIMRDVDENLYHPMFDQQTQHDFHNQIDLHLSLENDEIYPIQTPASTPTLIPHSLEQTELAEESKPVHCTEPIDEQCDDKTGCNINVDNDFTYDDFDSYQSFPSDRNNVDNAIDKKIEEFIQNKRNKANPKICTICNKLFRTNYKLKEHMASHDNNSKYRCEYEGCNKALKSKIGLKEHTAQHYGEFNFSCDVCEKKFLLRSYFIAHQKIHSNIRNFACNICSKTFKSKQNLVNHENVHYSIKAFFCQLCEKSFTTKTNLDVHVKTHTQLEQFECNVCKKIFKTKPYLKIHMKIHYKELQNYYCSFCEKTFIQLCDLKTHSKTHLNLKDFVCEICGLSFSRKDTLKLHVATHSKIKNFVCEICQKTFTRKASLNKHRKKCNTQ